MKKIVRLFLLLSSFIFSQTYAQTYPFQYGQKLGSAALNQAFSNAHITSGSIANVTIANSSITGGNGSFVNLSSPAANLTGGNVDGTCIGCVTKAAGYFTTLTVTGAIYTSAILPSWNISATSSVAASGYSYAINTSSVPVTITLPASSANSTVTMLDYAGTFSTHNLTIQAPSGVNINGASGTPATLTVSTSWIKVICTYLDATIGYRCYQ